MGEKKNARSLLPLDLPFFCAARAFLCYLHVDTGLFSLRATIPQKSGEQRGRRGRVFLFF